MNVLKLTALTDAQWQLRLNQANNPCYRPIKCGHAVGLFYCNFGHNWLHNPTEIPAANQAKIHDGMRLWRKMAAGRPLLFENDEFSKPFRDCLGAKLLLAFASKVILDSGGSGNLQNVSQEPHSSMYYIRILYSYLTGNALHLHYRTQPVNAV
jgi:hypothetical protein